MTMKPSLPHPRWLALMSALLCLASQFSTAAPPNGTVRIGYRGHNQVNYSSVPDIPNYEVIPLGDNFIPKAINDNLMVVGVKDHIKLMVHHGGNTHHLAPERRAPYWVDLNEVGVIATIYSQAYGPFVSLFWMDPEADPFTYDWKVHALPNIVRYGRAAWNDLGDLLYEVHSSEGDHIKLPVRTEGHGRIYNLYSGEDTQLTEHVITIDKNHYNVAIGLQMTPRDINNYGDHVCDFLDEESYFESNLIPRRVVREDRYSAVSFNDRLDFLPHKINDRGTIIGKRSHEEPDLIIRDQFGTRLIAPDLSYLYDNPADLSNPADGLEEIVAGKQYWKRNIETDANGRPTGRPAPDFWAGTVGQLARFPNSWFNITATCISANGAIAGTANYYSSKDPHYRVCGWYLAPAGILTDWNRDGRIDHKDRKIAATSQLWRFWVNDDDDDGPEARSSRDDLPAADSPDHANDHVDGLRDLVDFFPLFLDLKRFLAKKDLNKVRIRLSHGDEALRFVYTSLTPQSLHLKGSSLINTGCGPDFKQPLAHAPSEPIPVWGTDLSPDFVRKIADNGGVLLLEASAPTNEPLIMKFYYENKLIFQNRFDLSVGTVRQMMRILNLRNADEKFTGADTGPWPTDLAQPENLPDHWLSATTGQDTPPTLIHLHGFNWSGSEIPAAHAEIFKRFFQSGSPARFIGVSWYSDQGTIDLFQTTFDYNENVINALVTAPLLRAGLGAFEGSPMALFSHSLGTLLAASSVAEHGLPAQQLFLVNSAIPAESINGRPGHWRHMVHPTWKGFGDSPKDYAPHLHAANWSDLFPDGDFRASLRWTNRLAHLPDLCKVINFYSSGEDVLRPSNGDLPSLVDEIWHREEIWAYNEMVKGTNTLAATLTGDRHGGWGFNRHYMRWVDPGGPAHPPAGEWQPLSVDDANRIDPLTTLSEPFFLPFAGADPDFPQWGDGDWLYHEQTIANARLPDPKTLSPPIGLLKNRAKIIAEAIPALCDATGATSLPDIPLFQNINLDAAYRDPAKWPLRADVGKRQRWLHSDYLNPALPFVHRLYETCVESLLAL